MARRADPNPFEEEEVNPFSVPNFTLIPFVFGLGVLFFLTCLSARSRLVCSPSAVAYNFFCSFKAVIWLNFNLGRFHMSN